MELIDTFVMIVYHGLAQKEDQQTCKKLSLKSTFTKDKY
jgi:hypothetical protein